MLVIAELGNPGARYARNRHNIGFMAVDAIAEARRFGPFRARHQGLMTDGLIGDERVMLLKPQTYMNDPDAASAKLCAMRSSTLAPSSSSMTNSTSRPARCG